MPAPLFISHGAPDVLVRNTPAHRAIKALGRRPKPSAYVIVSAHWQSGAVRITASERPATIHDFHGFGEELERFVYPAPGAPELAENIRSMLAPAGIDAQLDHRRGLDHGAWVAMGLIRPQADIPVIQVSLPRDTDRASLELGSALAPLARQNIQLIGSGAITHSLADSLPMAEDGPPARFAQAFRTALRPYLQAADIDAVLTWRDLPQADRNHPTPEHFRPLLFAMAAAGDQAEDRTAACLHTSWSRSALAMDIWEFG
ncbi:class III extradiol ring-cleavage dioxygenase [Maricaulis sp.]|uniref:DODA-type extradiol aromatic ring-opening family dioxygenase n=1 Tax=Maricaulis sp. TaxID=1486257 RepID=UPI00261374A1|nr:class III extradiol ring-cleavage dioxygenase [Maricaulis sp.]